MSLRRRILLGSGLLIAVPLLLLAIGIRQQMQHRLTAQYAHRVETLMAIIAEDLAGRGQELSERLTALKAEMADDNRFRLALAPGRDDLRPYLLDYAGKAMGLLGLDMLQVHDRRGVILSSGHYRNEYGRTEQVLPRLLAKIPQGSALVKARRPESAFLALARLDSLTLGGQSLTLVAGVRIDGPFLADLARDQELAVSLVFPDGALSSDPALQAQLEPVGRASLARPEMTLDRGDFLLRAEDLPLIEEPGPGARLKSARLIVTHPRAPLRAILRSLNLWLGLALLVTLCGALILASWLAGRISRPLDLLAHKAASVDLDRLDADFPTERQDEVGVLSRTLAAMTSRLRSSVASLREAERRATLGEVARQVNHDLRNGFTPLRNVIRHFATVAADRPEQLGNVFRERQSTLEAGLDYLEDLAANYARLAPSRQKQSCAVNAIVRDCVATGSDDHAVQIHLDLDPELPAILADPIGLRRIIENLLSNARQSYSDHSGQVIITTRSETDPENSTQQNIMLTIQDTGCGIGPGDLERIFNDFFTTKQNGSGLGLSNVRRLVADFEGRITVDSEPGRGTTFTVCFPAQADVADSSPQKSAKPHSAKEPDP